MVNTSTPPTPQGFLRHLDWRYRGPTLEPGLGLGLTGEHLVAVVDPTSCWPTTHRKFHEGKVQSELGGSRGRMPPNPRAKPLAMGT